MRIHGNAGAVYLAADVGAAPARIANVYAWTMQITTGTGDGTKYAEPQKRYLRENMPDYAGTISAWWSADERTMWRLAFSQTPVELVLYQNIGEPAFWRGPVALSIHHTNPVNGAVEVRAEWVPAKLPPRVSAKLESRTGIRVGVAPLGLHIVHPLSGAPSFAVAVAEGTLAAHPLFASAGLSFAGVGDVKQSPALTTASGIAFSTAANFTRGAASLEGGGESIVMIGTSGKLVIGGSSTVAARPAPAAAASINESGSAASPSFSYGFYTVRYCFWYVDGVSNYTSDLSPQSGTWVMSGGNKFHVYGLSLGPAFVTKRLFYWAYGGSGGAGPYTYASGNNLQDVNDNTSTDVHLNIANINALPPSTPFGYYTGNSYMYVNNIERFPPSGSALVAGQTISWTSKSGSSGVGYLGGVTGITANIAVGDTITVV